METMRAIFERASILYNQIFMDWLYIPFIVRTLILLLVMWIFVYACAQVLQYLLVPLLVLFFYHVLFRAWNFLFVETAQEWIYIHYYADDSPFLSRFYLRLCDTVKRNHLILLNTRYSGILYKGHVRRVTVRLMAVSLVVVSLWTLAFGLYNEYAADLAAPVEVSATEHSNAEDTVNNNEQESDHTMGEVVEVDGGAGQNDKGVDPQLFPESGTLYFLLNKHGAGGSYIRDLPGLTDGTPVEVVKGDTMLEYLGEYTPDRDNDTLFWIKVRTPSDTEGYISSRLLTLAGA